MPLLVYYMWILLGILVPLSLLFASDDVNFYPSMLLIIFIVIYSSFRVSRVVTNKRKRIATLTFWVFVYIFFGIVPLLQVANQAFSWWSSYYDDQIITRAAIIALWGIFAFDIGYYAFSSKRIDSLAPSILQRAISKKSVILAGMMALTLSAIFLPYLGGITYLFDSRVQRGSHMAENLDKSAMLLFNTLSVTPLYVASLSAMAIWVASNKGFVQKVGIKWKLMSVVLLLGTFILNNPISTARFMVGTIVLSFFFLQKWKRSLGFAVVFFLVGGLLVIFPMSDLFRNSLDSSITERFSNLSIIEDLTSKGDFDAFQQLANSILVTDEEGMQLGRQLSGAVFFWFPRSIWQTKPLSTGEFIAEGVGYKFTNLSAPLWAEFYTDGGILLVIVGFVFYGLFVRIVDQSSALSDQQPGVRVITIFLPIFAGYQIFLLRGALMPALAYFMPMILFLVLFSIGGRSQPNRRRRYFLVRP